MDSAYHAPMSGNMNLTHFVHGTLPIAKQASSTPEAGVILFMNPSES